MTLNLTFPEEYPNNPDLAGQAVVFNVTINSISATKIPELTEEYVKEYTEYDSIEAFKEGVRAQLQELSDEYFESDKKYNVLQAIVDNATFSSIPQNLIDYYAYVYRNYVEQQMLFNYGVSLDYYLTIINMSEEEFGEIARQNGESQAKMEIVQKAIADAEGIDISDDEYNELLEDYLAKQGYSSEENLRQYETKEQTIENMRLQKAWDYVVEQAVIKEEPIDSTKEN